MTGTPKQINWANQIRSEATPGIKELCTLHEVGRALGRLGVTAAQVGVTDRAGVDAFCSDVFERAVSINDAKWWIDNRIGADVAAFERAVAEAAGK